MTMSEGCASSISGTTYIIALKFSGYVETDFELNRRRNACTNTTVATITVISEANCIKV